MIPCTTVAEIVATLSKGQDAAHDSGNAEFALRPFTRGFTMTCDAEGETISLVVRAAEITEPLIDLALDAAFSAALARSLGKLAAGGFSIEVAP